MQDEFISAKPSPAVWGFFQRVLPLVLPWLGIVSVDYRGEDIALLHSLAGRRVLLTPNHPTNTEPVLLFHLSGAVRQPFHFLACRESFDHLGGLWGTVIRRIGAFSVVRGTADRASFRATRELLARPDTKLVIFPEGEVYSQNDSLLPFHSGVFQLAFWAAEDVRKAQDETGEALGNPDTSLFIVPVAIKYRFVQDMSRAIRASLLRLEKFTGVAPNPSGTEYERLRHIGEAMLHSLEHEYRLPVDKDAGPDLTPRLNAVKEAILHRVAAAAGVALPKGDTLPERMRALIHVIETVTREEPREQTPYDTKLARLQQERARPLLRDLGRLANWIAVYDGYVAANPTPERMVDLLTRLERECFGEAKIRGARKCIVRLGTPIDLGECWDAYKASRRTELTRVTREVEARVEALLSQM
jgi:1-acyl-sn-glycerol-3-phosphate acyltransferase